MLVSFVVQKIDISDSMLKLMKDAKMMIDGRRKTPYSAPFFYMISMDEENCLAASGNTTEGLSMDSDVDVLGGDGSSTENWGSGGDEYFW